MAQSIGTANETMPLAMRPERIKDADLRMIYEVSKLLASSLDLSKTLSGVLNLLSVNLETWHGMIFLQGNGGELRLVGSSGIPPETLEQRSFKSGEGITGRIFKSGIPSVVPDVSQEPLFLNRFGTVDDSEGKTISYIGVPIRAVRTVIGVLAIERIMIDRSTHSFDRDVKLLTMIANLIGQTVRLYQNIAAERNQLIEEKQMLKRALQSKYSLENVIGISKAMQDVFAQVHQSAPSRSTVLLRGESGTGKEVIARAIHFMSPRKDAPFIKLNCAALSETLLETELFGHEKGAFTGAHALRKGRFELANGGTLFLDEIGDISPTFQAKLLRVLQEREFERVGGSHPIKADFRLITATNRNLEQAVAREQFRADLYYRINVVSIFLPPLRERREDIPLLVEHFLDKFNKENGRKLTITPDAMNMFVNCNWAGNVRELENCIERTATMTRGDVVHAVDLSCKQERCMGNVMHMRLPTVQSEPFRIPVIASTEPPAPARNDAPMPASSRTMPENERDRLIWAMEQCGWVQAKAARLLSLTPRQIGYALMKHSIDVKKL